MEHSVLLWGPAKSVLGKVPMSGCSLSRLDPPLAPPLLWAEPRTPKLWPAFQPPSCADKEFGKCLGGNVSSLTSVLPALASSSAGPLPVSTNWYKFMQLWTLSWVVVTNVSRCPRGKEGQGSTSPGSSGLGFLALDSALLQQTLCLQKWAWVLFCFSIIGKRVVEPQALLSICTRDTLRLHPGFTAASTSNLSVSPSPTPRSWHPSLLPIGKLCFPRKIIHY